MPFSGNHIILNRTLGGVAAKAVAVAARRIFPGATFEEREGGGSPALVLAVRSSREESFSGRLPKDPGDAASEFDRILKERIGWK